MKPLSRRLILGLGAALLVGGWGTTRYADEQQQSIPTAEAHLRGSAERIKLWSEGYGGEVGEVDLPPSKTIYAAGVVSMAIGAGLIGFAIPRPGDRSHPE